MAKNITFIGCVVTTIILLLCIKFAGPDLLLPAVFMIIAVLVGGLCIYVVVDVMAKRNEIMKDWEANNPE